MAQCPKCEDSMQFLYTKENGILACPKCEAQFRLQEINKILEAGVET